MLSTLNCNEITRADRRDKMRVPNISTYVNSTYRLGTLTSNLEDANEVASTQKQINEISDDPLGLSQVISLKNTSG